MATSNEEKGMDVSFFIIVAFVLIAGIVCSVFWVSNMRPGRSSESEVSAAGEDTADGAFSSEVRSGRRVRLTPTPTVDPDAPVSLDDAVTAINSGGCPACHTIPDIPNAAGQIGPDLSNIGSNAATRREGYSAEEYLRESILNPNAFIVPECPTGPCVEGIMVIPELDDETIDIIVEYLTSLGVE